MANKLETLVIKGYFTVRQVVENVKKVNRFVICFIKSSFMVKFMAYITNIKKKVRVEVA